MKKSVKNYCDDWLLLLLLFFPEPEEPREEPEEDPVVLDCPEVLDPVEFCEGDEAGWCPPKEWREELKNAAAAAALLDQNSMDSGEDS